MDYITTIRHQWDERKDIGTISLFLNIDLLKRYAMPLELHVYEQGIGVIVYPINKRSEFQKARKEIEAYEEILTIYALDNESKFHGSHILYMLIDHIRTKGRLENQQRIKTKIHNRIYLVKNLMDPKYINKYDIEIKGRLNDFTYHFYNDPTLQNDVTDHLIKTVKAHLKEYDPKVYRLLMKGATEKELEQAVERQSNYQINKVLVANLVRKILNYLNSETLILKNVNSGNDLSLTNTQGNFIYEVLTIFQAYKFKKSAKVVVNHHDAIRKLLKRSLYEDQENSN